MTPLARGCWRPSRIVRTGLAAAILGGVALFVACTPTASPTPPLQATVQPESSPLARFGQPPSPSPGTLDALVAQAVADAADRAGAAPADVSVVSVEAREWPDRSLGCPRPGLGYAQVITPGYVIVVEARGRRFEYHTDQSQIARCDR